MAENYVHLFESVIQVVQVFASSQGLSHVSKTSRVEYWQRCLGFRPDIDKSPDFCRNQGLRLELSQKGSNPLSYWSFQHKFLRFCQHSLVLAIGITKVMFGYLHQNLMGNSEIFDIRV